MWQTKGPAKFGQHLLPVHLMLVRNAILQSLLALEEFNCALERELKLRKLEKGLTASYSKVLAAYRNCSERDVVTPSEFKAQMGKRKDRFAGSAQQDAQEFLTAFL